MNTDNARPTEVLLGQAIALHRQGKLNEAQAIYTHLLEHDSENIDLLQLMGMLATQSHQHHMALELATKAVKIHPGDPFLHCSLGMALHALDQHDAAVVSYDHAIQIHREYAEAYCARGVSHEALGRLEHALRDYEMAAAINPQYAEAYCNQGNVFQSSNNFEKALESYDKAIRAKPDYVEAFNNRGIVLKALDRLEAALQSYNQAIAIDPAYAEAYNNRGIVYKELQQSAAAIESYDQALRINPAYAEAYWNKSLALLLHGDFELGWQLYEWRWKRDAQRMRLRNFIPPLWLGLESVKDKTVLLHSEQGLGDTIQFCRYVQMFSQLGAKVILQVPESLRPLLMSLEGGASVVAQGAELPYFDYHCPLLSLPLAFKTQVATTPAQSCYLTSDAQKVLEWAHKLGEKTKIRVGLVWSGSPTHKNDARRSILLSALAIYLPANVDYVCLQKELRDVDRATLEQLGNIQYFGNAIHDFGDTAALCALMDVVISVDTSVAHLAGALGKPTWLLLPYAPDWRWMLNRSDSPWYPSMTLYRQNNSMQWEHVFEKIQTDLMQMV
jgi:tetratricopeptide (TPR) repeat protein